MWQVVSRPDVLIYLDASDETIQIRGRRFPIPGLLPDQRRRLQHARAHCDLYLMTDSLTVDRVLAEAVAFLTELGGPNPGHLTES
jgi:hypothetical protein